MPLPTDSPMHELLAFDLAGVHVHRCGQEVAIEREGLGWRYVTATGQVVRHCPRCRRLLKRAHLRAIKNGSRS